MQKHITLVTLAALLAAPVFAAPETFVVDPNHTYPRFEYSHFGFSNQIQRFDKTAGTIVFDGQPIDGFDPIKMFCDQTTFIRL